MRFLLSFLGVVIASEVISLEETHTEFQAIALAKEFVMPVSAEESKDDQPVDEDILRDAALSIAEEVLAPIELCSTIEDCQSAIEAFGLVSEASRVVLTYSLRSLSYNNEAHFVKGFTASVVRAYDTILQCLRFEQSVETFNHEDIFAARRALSSLKEEDIRYEIQKIFTILGRAIRFVASHIDSHQLSYRELKGIRNLLFNEHKGLLKETLESYAFSVIDHISSSDQERPLPIAPVDFQMFHIMQVIIDFNDLIRQLTASELIAAFELDAELSKEEALNAVFEKILDPLRSFAREIHIHFFQAFQSIA